MPENILSLNIPQSLWDAVEKLAKAQECPANQVAMEALEHYLSDLMTVPRLSPEEEKAKAIKRLLKNQIRHRLICEKFVAEGKIHPLPKDIPPEQVRHSLSGIKGSLAAEVIKEREEGW